MEFNALSYKTFSKNSFPENYKMHFELGDTVSFPIDC